MKPSLAGIFALALAGYYGGWGWTLLCVAVLLTLWRVDFTVSSIVSTVGVSFFWLALFHWFDDRRLFFPFAMQLAVQLPYLLLGRVSRPALIGGGGMISAFLLIRIAQSATVRVLTVELIVAVAVLVFILWSFGSTASIRVRVLAGMAGSALAFAGLAI